MDYSFKRGFKPDMERIRKVLEEEFPAEIKESDGMLSLSFGALKSIQVSINEKKLNVTTESDTAKRRSDPGYQQALPKFFGKSDRIYCKTAAADGQKRGLKEKQRILKGSSLFKMG